VSVQRLRAMNLKMGTMSPESLPTMRNGRGGRLIVGGAPERRQERRIVQFVRNASIGDSRVPRRAGRYEAIAATASRMIAVVVNVHGSSGST